MVTASERIDGRFDLLRRIGAGAFGTVWEARDLTTGDRVALKILHPLAQGRPWMVDRFIREAAILEHLDHPAIARAIAARVKEGGPAYLALEYLEGALLSEWIGRAASARRPPAPGEVLAIVQGLAAALDHAHRAEVVHRDLKPRNVMLLPGAPVRVKVLDFGVAKLVGVEEKDATTVGRLLGSLLYMAPEQFGGAVDHRADVFALGCLAFEMFTARRPWAHDRQGALLWAEDGPVESDRINNYGSIMERIVRGPRPVPREWWPALPPEVDPLLCRALAVRPEDRFTSAGAFAQALAAVWPPPVAVPAPAAAGPLPRRGLQRLALACGALALGAGVGAVWVDRPAPAPEPPPSVEPPPAPRARAAPPEEDLQPIELTPPPAVGEPRPSRLKPPSKEAPPRAPSAAAAKHAANHGALLVLLERAKMSPHEAEGLNALHQAIVAEADQIEDTTRRATIKRRAAASLQVADLDGLARCIDLLVQSRPGSATLPRR